MRGGDKFIQGGHRRPAETVAKCFYELGLAERRADLIAQRRPSAGEQGQGLSVFRSLNGARSLGLVSVRERKDDLRGTAKKEPNLFILLTYDVGVCSVLPLPIRCVHDTLVGCGSNPSNVHLNHSVLVRSSPSLASLLRGGVLGPIRRHTTIVISECAGLYTSVGTEPSRVQTHEQAVAVGDVLDRPSG